MMTRIAVIGLGRRLREMWRRLREIGEDVRLVAFAEPDAARAQQIAKELELDGVNIFSDAKRLLEHADQYDAVMIGTRCHMHADLAISVAPTNLPLFLEKPVAITREQLIRLAAAYRGREDRVLVSFPLRFTPLFRKALEIARSGRLGTVNQVQAWNNVPYGGVYFGEWYRNYNEAGGLFLQKATHDFDYINLLLSPAKATSIAATTTRQIFGGDMPHNLMCSECDRTDTCIESPENLKRRGDDGGAAHHHPVDRNHWCLFSREIRNEDAGSALLMYDNGTHASYTQNFASRRGAGKRGATITGYTGTLEFDWYTETIRLVDHHTPTQEEFKVCATEGHMGGDHRMLRDFLSLVRDGAPSTSSLRDGLVSVAMCLAAKESALSHEFRPIESPWPQVKPLVAAPVR